MTRRRARNYLIAIAISWPFNYLLVARTDSLWVWPAIVGADVVVSVAVYDWVDLFDRRRPR